MQRCPQCGGLDRQAERQLHERRETGRVGAHLVFPVHLLHRLLERVAIVPMLASERFDLRPQIGLLESLGLPQSSGQPPDQELPPSLRACAQGRLSEAHRSSRASIHKPDPHDARSRTPTPGEEHAQREHAHAQCDAHTLGTR